MIVIIYLKSSEEIWHSNFVTCHCKDNHRHPFATSTLWLDKDTSLQAQQIKKLKSNKKSKFN